MQQKFNLLVIENEEVALQPLSLLATRLGHRVIRTESHDLPVTVMHAWLNYIQVVVFDWTLSCAIEGGPLVKALHHVDPEMPFIIVSGYGEKTVRPLLPKNLNCRFVIKPFLSYDFELAIQSCPPKSLLRT